MSKEKSLEKIVVLPAPEFSAEEEARLQLKAAAIVLHMRSAEAHAEGMFLEGQSVRLDQLSELLHPDEVVRVRDIFVKEGVLEIESVGAELTSPGGSA